MLILDLTFFFQNESMAAQRLRRNGEPMYPQLRNIFFVGRYATLWAEDACRLV